VHYDCIIIGGGIAGLQAAIQLGRYDHRVLVIDANDGRSTLCKCYHNLLGWPDGVSGEELRHRGRLQAERLGVSFCHDSVVEARKVESLHADLSIDRERAAEAQHLSDSRHDSRFQIRCGSGAIYEAKHLLIATGILDRFPQLPGLVECLGISVYVCPDCDGYETKHRRTVVMGAGNVGANMALTLSYWSDDIVFVNHERAKVDGALLEKLSAKGIKYVEEPLVEVEADKTYIKGVRFESGRRIEAERGFIAFGGNEVRSQIARQLGVHCLDNRHIVVDARTKMTNVPNVWAAGDVVAHSEQVSIAMGDGAQAAIWIHKHLMDS
jgi:thioredoxin reductase